MTTIPGILPSRPVAAALLLAGLALATADARAAVELKSPDGAFVVTFDVKDAGAPGARCRSPSAPTTRASPSARRCRSSPASTQ